MTRNVRDLDVVKEMRRRNQRFANRTNYVVVKSEEYFSKNPLFSHVSTGIDGKSTTLNEKKAEPQETKPAEKLTEDTTTTTTPTTQLTSPPSIEPLVSKDEGEQIDARRSADDESKKDGSHQESGDQDGTGRDDGNRLDGPSCKLDAGTKRKDREDREEEEKGEGDSGSRECRGSSGGDDGDGGRKRPRTEAQEETPKQEGKGGEEGKETSQA